MNKSRIFNEVGDLYQASVINEGKSRFPGIGKDTFKVQTDKKVTTPEVKPGDGPFVTAKSKLKSGPEHDGAKTMFNKNAGDIKTKAGEETSVYSNERFTQKNPEYTQDNKKVKRKEKMKKMQKESINNSMTKSIFDKLYEAVINENDLPGDDNMEMHDAEALDLPVGGEEGEVTITLDRETAKKLHDVLMSVLGEEHEGEEPEGEEGEDEEGSPMGEATDIEEIKIPGASYVKDGKKHPWEVKPKGNIVGDETDKLVDGEEGDGEINKQEDFAGTSHGHALVNAKSGKPTPVTPNSNQVSKQNPGSRTHRNVGQVAFKK